MPVIFLIAFGLIFAPSPSWAYDVPKKRSALEECKVFSQASLRECLTRKSRESTNALKVVDEKTIIALTRWDEDEKYISSAKERLAASTKAFAQYRQAQCAFAASLGGGAIGSALELRRLACIADLNNERAASLLSTVAGLPTK